LCTTLHFGSDPVSKSVSMMLAAAFLKNLLKISTNFCEKKR